MTSKLGHTDYLIPNDIIIMLLLCSNLTNKSSLVNGFAIRFSDISEVAYLLCHFTTTESHQPIMTGRKRSALR